MIALTGVKKCRPFLEKGKWYLFLDGADDKVVLSEVGAEQLQTALCMLPIYKEPGLFWGYNLPKNEPLVNCELPEAGDVCVFLASEDSKALEVVADHMSVDDCWVAEPVLETPYSVSSSV